MSMPRRLLTMAGAYIAASVVAGVILAPWMVWSPGAQIGPVHFDLLQITPVFVSIVSSLVAVLALPPAVAVSWYAERRGKRSAFFYGGAGAVVSLVALAIYAALVIWNDTSPERFSSMGEASDVAAAIVVITSVFVIAGVAGGLTYWAIAGRKAGSHTAAAIAT
jgi:hypothetical protein